MTAFETTDYDIKIGEAQQLISEKNAQIIDVREPYEHTAGHIPHDRHLDMHHLPLEADTIDRNRPVIFYCRGGFRSAMATEAFRASGWDAYNLAGGLLAWADADQPIEPAAGSVAEH